MSFWTDLIQGLQTNPVLRERVALAEQKYEDMEMENKRLKEVVTALTSENEELKRQIKQVPVAVALTKEMPEIRNGLYYFGGDMSTPYCPRCYEREGKKHVMSSVRHFGHKCTLCDNMIHR